MKAIVYTKLGPPEALRPFLSNQAHSPLTIRLGLIGAVLHFIAKIVSVFSQLHLAPDIGVGIGRWLVPTAIQEMVFAVWMIIKGFNPSAVASEPAKVL